MVDYKVKDIVKRSKKPSIVEIKLLPEPVKVIEFSKWIPTDFIEYWKRTK